MIIPKMLGSMTLYNDQPTATLNTAQLFALHEMIQLGGTGERHCSHQSKSHLPLK